MPRIAPRLMAWRKRRRTIQTNTMMANITVQMKALKALVNTAFAIEDEASSLERDEFNAISVIDTVFLYGQSMRSRECNHVSVDEL